MIKTAENLLNTIHSSVVWLIDSLCFTRLCFEIFTDFYKVNVRRAFILFIIFQGEHLLDRSRFTWMSIHNFLDVSIKYGHQALFWGRFICSSLNHHCIALHMFWNYRDLIINLSIKYHLTKTYYWEISSHNWYHFM